jgi:hypothetical protein
LLRPVQWVSQRLGRRLLGLATGFPPWPFARSLGSHLFFLMPASSPKIYYSCANIHVYICTSLIFFLYTPFVALRSSRTRYILISHAQTMFPIASSTKTSSVMDVLRGRKYRSPRTKRYQLYCLMPILRTPGLARKVGLNYVTKVAPLCKN